jgi:electron transfer flavoprotein beta subunit
VKILVLVKLVPDLVEELAIDAEGRSVDTAWLRQIINELDNHALEQAILLKEALGGEVIVVAPETEGVDDVLFTASAKGADRLIRLSGDAASVNNHALGRAVAGLVGEVRPDLVMTGVQANDDLDGPVGPLLAEIAGMPYVGYVAGVEVSDGGLVVRKEYAGGLVGVLRVALPAVLGVQVAAQPPRYVAVSRIRQAMAASSIEDLPVADVDQTGGGQVTRMYLPETSARATMLAGGEQAVADQLIEILRDLGLL